MFGCLPLDGPYREGGNSVLETILKLFLQQVAVPFEKLQSGVVADVKPDRAKCLGFGLTDHSPNPKIAVIILSMRSCMSQICWWISECSSVSISAARRSSSSAAFRLRVSSGNSSALRRRQVLDRLECRGWVVVRVPSALQPSLAGSSEQAQKLNSLPRMPTRPKPSRLKRGLGLRDTIAIPSSAVICDMEAEPGGLTYEFHKAGPPRPVANIATVGELRRSSRNVSQRSATQGLAQPTERDRPPRMI